MSFRGQLDKAYEKKVVGTAIDRAKKVALAVDASLVKNTPVDTGRARSNWHASLNTPDLKTTQSTGGNNTIRTALSDVKLEDTIFITNALPYIRRLNDGYSDQQPAGFVERAVQTGNKVK